MGRKRTYESPRIKAPRFLRPDLWAGLAPNGIGKQKPDHYGDMVRTVWDNRRNLPYAWRILSQGVCDGCALGVAGFHDWTIEGIHLCTTRLSFLRVNTMGPVADADLADVERLRTLTAAELRDLGRLPYPMVRRAGDRGFTRVSWDEALDLVAGRMRASLERDPDGDRIAFYLTARGLTNEVYYVAQKAARAIGTPNIDNAARICHAPSSSALKATVGVAATTVSYTDVIESDLIVLFGSDVANAQPVFTKYLYLARKKGATVAVVNPYREPGLERYWVPSNAESALFGTKLASEFFQVDTGGDTAFINGVIKILVERDWVDHDFIRDHTTGFDELRAHLDTQSFSELERLSGASRATMEQFARMYSRAGSAVLIWSMGITQHRFGTDNVSAIANLALVRGNIGRPNAGLMPIRGHSGVQGGAEMGAYATALPGAIAVTAESAAALSEQYGFDVPARAGITAEEMVEAGGHGGIDVLYSSGGNFLEALPDPREVRRCLESVPVRVHQDIVLSTQMLVDASDTVVVLPAATRYEQPGGGCETTTERRIVFSPEIEGPRPGEVRAEWQVFADLARRVRPDRAQALQFADARAVREEIARIVPSYEGIQHLAATGDQVQWGGRRLCEGGTFPTPDGRAHFAVVTPSERESGEGRYLLSTRRGKQFNTMIWKDVDPLTGAGRDAVFVSPEDAVELGVGQGDRVVVRSEQGSVAAVVTVVPIKPGNVQMFFPESNPLLRAGRRDPVSGVPDYNALVSIERA